MSKELSDMLQNVLEDIGEVLEDIENKLESGAEGIAEDWKKTRAHLHKLNERAHDAVKHFEQNVDETNLQAHLAMMEASERAEAIKDSVSHFIDHAKNRSKTEFDHAKVQSKLAQMEARDFFAEAQAEIGGEILSDAVQARQLGLRAAAKLKKFSSELRESVRY